MASILQVHFFFFFFDVLLWFGFTNFVWGGGVGPALMVSDYLSVRGSVICHGTLKRKRKYKRRGTLLTDDITYTEEVCLMGN